MDVEVWVFFPKSDAGTYAKARDLIRGECKKKGWQYQERPTRRIRTQGGGSLQIVEARDAVAVYQRLHRSNVAMLTVRDTRFCYEPPEERAIRRDLTLPLVRYCQYKAFCAELNPTNQQAVHQAWMENFKNWIENIGCDGDSDPRCLPFLTFLPERKEFNHLSSNEGRSRFSIDHGDGKGAWLDQKSMSWERNPQAFHSREQLHVSGKLLSRGLHWDVQNDSGKPLKISSPLAIWEVFKYINVFPDGEIKGRPPFAQIIFPRKGR